MVIKYTMRSMMKKQSNVINSLTGASANNGQGFFDKFSYYGVNARPFMSSPHINNGAPFGGPSATSLMGAAGSGAGAGAGGVGLPTAGTNQFSAGQIAGIVIGCVVGALLLGLLPLLCCCLLLKKKKKERKVVEEYRAPEGQVVSTTTERDLHPDAG
jgi:hypothetical protein